IRGDHRARRPGRGPTPRRTVARRLAPPLLRLPERDTRVKVRTLAPAKINWTLEVLGKRVDGYHEIKSVMQTITLCDEVEVERAPDRRKLTEQPRDAPPGHVLVRVSPHEVGLSGSLDFANE